MSYPVEPNCLLTNETNVLAPTRFRYVANAFRMWRGSVRFLFMVAANQYHSGRLRFVYSLGGAMPQPYVDNYPRTFTQVVDLRKGAHFIIDCPYFASTPWRLVPQVWNNATPGFEQELIGPLDDQPARLDIFVENELRVTSTTSTSVQVVMFQCAGPDFEFAVPIAPRVYPYINTTVPDGDTTAQPQGLDFMPIDMASGLTSTQPQNNISHKYTVGENLTSVRQLIKRYQIIGSGTYQLNQATPPNFVLLPFMVAKPINNASEPYDMLAYFSFQYQFRRGSIRYMLVSNDNNIYYVLRYDPSVLDTDLPAFEGGKPFGARAPIFTVGAYPNGATIKSLALTATLPFVNNLQGSLEVEFPYYSRYHKLKTKVYSNQDTDQTPTVYTQDIQKGLVPAGLCYFQISSVVNDATTRELTVLRSAADDFTLGYLLGSPFCEANTVLQP